MGIEPTSQAWKASALPLSYARINSEPEGDVEINTTPKAKSSSSWEE